ncbi:MAG: NAD(P)-dependent oxidoreductase [Gemmatimonadales bacterium]
MRLFILGATGRTGRELVDIALARGHQVTAFVRSPAKITRRDPRLALVEGDPLGVEELSSALPGHDAVISALGPLPRQAMTRTTLLEESASSAMTALPRAGVRRFLIVSSALLFPGGGPVAALLRLMLRPHFRDLKAMENRVRAAAIDWTIARPPRLVAATDERYRAEPGALPAGANLVSSVLSWRAVAAFLLDAAEGNRHLREVVGICR